MRKLHYDEAGGGGLADRRQDVKKAGILKIVVYYVIKAVVSIVKFFPLLGEGLRERVYLGVRKTSRYECRPFRVKGLISNCRSLPSCSDRTSSCRPNMSGGAARFFTLI